MWRMETIDSYQRPPPTDLESKPTSGTQDSKTPKKIISILTAHRREVKAFSLDNDR